MAKSLTLISSWLLCSTFLLPAWAQKSFLYKWSFHDTSIQARIPACEPLTLDITSFDTTTNATKGTPPYYMLAFPDGGAPTTTLIGTSDTGASYTVTHPVGTRLLLSVVDADGNPGGTFAPQTVISGKNADCIVKQPTPTFFMTSNVTSELSTCEPLGIAIAGGTFPYTISLVAANAPSVTNETLKIGDNIYTYINRAAPGGQLLAAISDSNGQWASGSILLTTKGPTDTDCPGLMSSSSKGSPPPPPPQPTNLTTNTGASTTTTPGGTPTKDTPTNSPTTSDTPSPGNGVRSVQVDIFGAIILSAASLLVLDL